MEEHCKWIMKAVLCVLFFSPVLYVQAQHTGIKTNMLYWMTATPNFGLEWSAASHYTLSAVFGYNAFNFPNRATESDFPVNPKLHHWLVMPEAKYWFCRAFERSYLGVHALYGKYNVGGIHFLSPLRNNRYEGWGAGAGISFGYQWPIATYWDIELSVGGGYIYTEYNKFDCGACGIKEGNFRRHYFGPTKASVSFIYYIR